MDKMSSTPFSWTRPQGTAQPMSVREAGSRSGGAAMRGAWPDLHWANGGGRGGRGLTQFYPMRSGRSRRGREHAGPHVPGLLKGPRLEMGAGGGAEREPRRDPPNPSDVTEPDPSPNSTLTSGDSPGGVARPRPASLIGHRDRAPPAPFEPPERPWPPFLLRAAAAILCRAAILVRAAAPTPSLVWAKRPPPLPGPFGGPALTWGGPGVPRQRLRTLPGREKEEEKRPRLPHVTPAPFPLPLPAGAARPARPGPAERGSGPSGTPRDPPGE